MAVTALVGAQWGDEGKGKVIDILAERSDLVVRAQGGNNAGVACCWYNPGGLENHTKLKIDYEIKNLWEVEELL